MDTPHNFSFLSQTIFNGFVNAPPEALQPEAGFRVLGLPYDGATTNRTGARLAPRAIRSASHMLCDATHPYFGIAPAGALSDGGDMAFPHTDLAAMRKSVQTQLLALAPKHNIVLGGDHSITLPILRALRAQHAEPLALIHFDAHCDTWEDHLGEPSGHGTWVYEAVQEGLIAPQRTVQIGLRSSGDKAARDYIRDQGGLIFTAHALRGCEGTQLQPVIDTIRMRLGASPVYLSFDIDALDPAFAPGTGTPEPAGLTSTQAMSFLENLAPLNFVGMDLCEVAPPFDHAELTTYLAAHLVWTYLCGQIAK